MSYYLPIMVNSRRLHVCHLMTQRERERAEMSREVPWGFIVHTENSPALLSLLPEEPSLIDEQGSHIPVDGSWGFVIVEESDNNYIVELTKRVQANRKDGNSRVGNLVVQGRVGDDQALSLSVDVTTLGCSMPVNVTIKYNHKVSEDVIETFSDSMTFYLCGPCDRVDSVALDFGSEASQVRFSGMDQNIPLVDVFHNILEGREKGQEMSKNGYWQGKIGDFLFKSVFWINFAPSIPTRYEDVPTGMAKRPFISPLVPKDWTSFDSLRLLPNLKLVELSQGGGYITYEAGDIKFADGTEIDYSQPNLADHQMRNSVLHIILSNFLHAIMSRVNTGLSDRFVRLVLMAPNVYYQDKVFDMMRWIYRDFEYIKKDYPRCKGIEVQVVSESDAAFIGARKCQRMDDVPGGVFLNIDSGKGTTDFSILQQSANLNKFVSLYRDGIPAAGNVLTYAYYEALYDYMRENGIDIQKWLTDKEAARSSYMIEFMEHLEEFKKHDSELGYREENGRDMIAVPNSYDVRDLDGLNRYLDQNKGKRIPFIGKYVKAKVKNLVSCLEESIGHYMEMQECVFARVVLSGRAFMCPVYREEVESMLRRRNWINVGESNVAWVGNQAKTCCLAGALAIESECDVNYNSGLIGSPLLTDCSPNFLKRLWVEKMKRSYTLRVGIDKSFFAEGSAGISTQNLRFRLGGRATLITSDTRTEKKIFFLGDKFALQEDSGRLRPIPSQDLQFTNDLFEILVKQSLFPYYEGSVGSPVNKYFRDEYDFSDTVPEYDQEEMEKGKSDDNLIPVVEDDRDNVSPDYKDNE